MGKRNLLVNAKKGNLIQSQSQKQTTVFLQCDSFVTHSQVHFDCQIDGHEVHTWANRAASFSPAGSIDSTSISARALRRPERDEEANWNTISIVGIWKPNTVR